MVGKAERRVLHERHCDLCGLRTQLAGIVAGACVAMTRRLWAIGWVTVARCEALVCLVQVLGTTPVRITGKPPNE
jgi:hypothetical protein